MEEVKGPPWPKEGSWVERHGSAERDGAATADLKKWKNNNSLFSECLAFLSQN